MSDSFKQLSHICCHVNGRSSSFRTVCSHFFLQTSDTVFDWSLEVYIASIRGIANVPIASRINRKKSINIEKSKLIFHLLLNLDLRKTNSFPEKMNMKQNTTSIIVAVTILLACVVQARYTDDDLDRVKRQMADAKASEYLALIRLGLASGCREIGCGLIDFHTSGRRKRDTGILRTLINKNRLLQNSDDSHL
ncbi:Hypothetical predicted protein [Mytilus galloprovincialis]|uniref:Uncharacterized protein n=1 Tax=Mytilus galloprovincialis TaxID=29158 RepID=A0A8B6DN55_MYTGA|nr:Hypothetical predicted protein [Mytilus galloprovincialis]